MRLAARPLADGACPVRAPSRTGRSHARVAARLAAAVPAGRPAGRALLLGPKVHRERPATRRGAFRPAAQASRQSAGAASAQGASRQAAVSLASLALQALLIVGLLTAALAWFTAAAGSPYSRLPEVVFARKLAVATFWKVADTVVNPLQYVGVFAANLVLQAWAVLLPVLQTLPEALLLAVTELGSLVLDVTLVLTAAFKAVLLKAVFWSVYCLDVLLQALGALLAALDAWLKSLLAWLLSKDPLGLLLSLLLARPFSGLAHLLLGGSKAAVQWTMVAVETACALLYAAPAALGVVLIPALYVAAAVWRRARRVVVSEPPLSFTLAELDERVARLQPLRVPPLPIEEKRIENELVGFVNAVGANLQPLRVPPLNLDQLAASNAAAGADSLTRAQAVDATVERVPLQASYSVVSSTEVTMGQPSAGYDGLAAVRQQMDSLQRTVANLPPLADAQLAKQAREQAEAAAVALAQAEAALAEAEAAFYAIDSSVTATTTTTTTLQTGVDDAAATLQDGIDIARPEGLDPATPKQPGAPRAAAPRAQAPSETKRISRSASGDVGNGPDRRSGVKDALIRGLAAGLGVAADVEKSDTQARKRKDE